MPGRKGGGKKNVKRKKEKDPFLITRLMLTKGEGKTEERTGAEIILKKKKKMLFFTYISF